MRVCRNAMQNQILAFSIKTMSTLPVCKLWAARRFMINRSPAHRAPESAVAARACAGLQPSGGRAEMTRCAGDQLLIKGRAALLRVWIQGGSMCDEKQYHTFRPSMIASAIKEIITFKVYWSSPKIDASPITLIMRCSLCFQRQCQGIYWPAKKYSIILPWFRDRFSPKFHDVSPA